MSLFLACDTYFGPLEFKPNPKNAKICPRMTLTPWQRANILAALNYLKDLARIGQNPQAQTLAQGLMEVLEPSRRTIRLQREAAQAATAGAQAGRERRQRDRRRSAERRTQQLPYTGPERRTGRDRRSGDRRTS
jgi:hypothetical protein